MNGEFRFDIYTQWICEELLKFYFLSPFSKNMFERENSWAKRARKKWPVWELELK